MLDSGSYSVISKLARGLDPNTGNKIGEGGIQIDQRISQALSSALSELRRNRHKSYYDLTDEEMELYNRLREYRYGKVKDTKRPAFRVAPDETFSDIAKKKPRSIESLHQIYGLRQKRIDAYGKDFLSVVEEHLKAKGRPT